LSEQNLMTSQSTLAAYATLLFGLLLASMIAAGAKDWQCGRDLVVLDEGDVSGIIHRNGRPKQAEDLIMGGINNRPSREFRWKNGTLHQRGKPCRLAGS
jgi:hypothetical protein